MNAETQQAVVTVLNECLEHVYHEGCRFRIHWAIEQLQPRYTASERLDASAGEAVPIHHQPTQERTAP